jgi:hypothetical protein
MKIAMIAKAEQVKFQALALYHLHVRQIRNTNLSKIRLSGDGAKTGKFGTIETHPIIIPGVLVNKRLQHLRSIILLVFRLLS